MSLQIQDRAEGFIDNVLHGELPHEFSFYVTNWHFATASLHDLAQLKHVVNELMRRGFRVSKRDNFEESRTESEPSEKGSHHDTT